MLRSPVPLLFLIAIVVVNPAESLPNETLCSPEVQLQPVPGSTSSEPNDIFAWTKFGSLLTITGASIFLFLTALCIKLGRPNPPMLDRFGYSFIFLCIGYFGIFVLFGAVGSQSIWTTIGSIVILVLIVRIARIIWVYDVPLNLSKSTKIFFLHCVLGSGCVTLLRVGIVNSFGSACLKGYDFIVGGAFLDFVGALGVILTQPPVLN